MGYVTPFFRMKPSASGRRSLKSTPTTTSPSLRYFRHAASSTGASCLHGTHQEAQKLTTTALPRSEARESSPSRSSRRSVNAGATGRSPRARAPGMVLPSSWTSFQTRSASRAATSPTASAWAPSLTRPATGVLPGDDEDRRPDGHPVEEPFRLGDGHPDAPVGERVSEGCGVGRPMDADAGCREAHPARPERVAWAGRNRVLALCPVGARWIPPRVLPLGHDLKAPERRRILRHPGGDAEGPDEVHAVVQVQRLR